MIIVIIGLLLIAGFSIVGLIGPSSLVGKPREPLTPGRAAVTAIIQLMMAAIAITAAILLVGS